MRPVYVDSFVGASGSFDNNARPHSSTGTGNVGADGARQGAVHIEVPITTAVFVYF